MRVDRAWMYNRLIPGKKGITLEFQRGLDEFVQFATMQVNFTSEGKIRCPCSKCKNRKYSDVDNVKLHLYRNGFLPNYYEWHAHGEPYIFPSDHRNNEEIGTASETTPSIGNSFRDMVFDAVGYDRTSNEPVQMDEMPNASAQRFYDLLNAIDEPLWPGCDGQSQLSTVARLLNIKSDYNLPEACYDALCQLIKDVTPEGDKMPKNFYETKKLVSGLGLPYEQIECCINGCMLFRKKYETLTECKFCNHRRWKPKKGSDGVEKNVPYARMHYLPLTPRLQRLYASTVTAKHMRWHAEHEPLSGSMSHPSDAEAWKSFNCAHPTFSAESRNVRLGLSTDGFTPFGQSGKQYSCWPVIVTPYNPPPGMCMKTPYMFLTALIPSPKNPKKKLDVYLQPLLDELIQLWEVGVPTYDISMRQNFQMRAALMWTISDFPAYGMLSGWSTVGRLSCPYCMEKSKAFRLQHSRKQCFFDCHRQFLPSDHPFRKNKTSFRKNKTENSPPPQRLSGDQIWARVKDLPTVLENGGDDIPRGGGEYHNWSKQSIFWSLPYWRTNLIRHNLDVMHIIKNFFDNIFNTIFDVKGKTKDNDNARRDLHEICRRNDLELCEGVLDASFDPFDQSQSTPFDQSQHTPGPEVVQPASSSSVLDASSEGKIHVWIEGDEILCNAKPNNKPMRSIRPIVQSMFLRPYPSWTKVPPSVRDIWYAEWMKQYKWDAKYNSIMRTTWEKKGNKSYKYLMDQVRNGEIKHEFVKVEHYEQLRALWDSEGYKKLSRTMSANRKSDCGGSHHSGGSIPATVHKQKLEEKYQRDYSQCDIYLFTHTTNTEEEVEQALERERLMLAGEEVDHEGPQLVFVDKRSEEIYGQYQEELAKEMARIASQTPEGEQPPPVNKVDVWLRVVGPPKKGRTVYGMGSLSYSCLEKSTAYRSSSSSSCSSAQPSDYVQTTEFQQSVEESVQKALSMYLGELKETNEHLKSEVASLTQQVRQLKGLDPSQDLPSNDI